MIISWSPVLCSVIKGLLVRCSCWKVVALVRGVEPRLPRGLPGSLYLWPLILNLHNYVATLASTVLTLQKGAICRQVCLVFGNHHHHNGCPDVVLGAFLVAFWSGSLGTLKAWCIPKLLQHGLCLSVMCPGMCFTSHFQIGWAVLTEVPNLAQSERFKDCPQCLQVLHKILNEFYTWQMLMLEAIVRS